MNVKHQFVRHGIVIHYFIHVREALDPSNQRAFRPHCRCYPSSCKTTATIHLPSANGISASAGKWSEVHVLLTRSGVALIGLFVCSFVCLYITK